MVKINEIKEKFVKGYDCSQIVFSEFAEKYGIDEKQALKLTSAFGGGMQQGSVCGAFVAALMVLGLKYGFLEDENLQNNKNNMMNVTKTFREKFVKQYGSYLCKDLIGYDVSTEEGLKGAIESNILLDFCPKLSANVIKMLEEVIND